jgi:hypothetical protein
MNKKKLKKIENSEEEREALAELEDDVMYDDSDGEQKQSSMKTR